MVAVCMNGGMDAPGGIGGSGGGAGGDGGGLVTVGTLSGCSSHTLDQSAPSSEVVCLKGPSTPPTAVVLRVAASIVP